MRGMQCNVQFGYQLSICSRTKLIQIHSAPTPKKTQRFYITDINWLMLLREIVTVYSENNTKRIKTLCGYNVDLLTLKVCGTYSYHWALKS
jgi:hypothetical protein